MWTRLKRVLQSEHQWAAEQLSAYLDDELSRSDRQRVEAHLKTCQVCREEYSALRWTVQLVSQSPAPRARRSFVITESMLEPSRPISTVYLYLRGATAAVAALLLVVLAGDLLLPHALTQKSVSQLRGGQAMPAVAEVPAEGAVSKAMPAQEEVEVTVEVEKEVVEHAPLAQTAVEEEVEAASVPMGTPLPPEQPVELSQPVPAAAEAEQESAGAAGEKPMALKAPSTEQISGTFSAIAGDQAVAEEQASAKEALPTPSPTPSASATPETTSLPVSRTVAAEIARSPRPTIPVAEAAGAEARGLSPRAPVSWRSTLRAAEVGLASLMILLIGGLLVMRARRK